MRNASTVLGIIRDRGIKGLPLEDVYRQLFNRDLYVRAYGRIGANAGAMTPGSTSETADGMSLAKIDAIIEALRYERYRWTPVRRVYIPKKDGRQRPLGLPTWSDKLVQEVIRLILEAYFEPQFSDRSHGFRPGRGCHTALAAITGTCHGVSWFIEGDISKCFDNLDHDVMMLILGERIHDNRFLRLLRNLLQAGYLEEWRYNATYSGSPQGGVVSPILANIYLNKLDEYVEQTLLPAYNRGNKRKGNPAYKRYEYQIRKASEAGDIQRVKELKAERRQLPAGDPQDPTFRRLSYGRYADDFLLGFTGPRVEAEDIKRQLKVFLATTLNLDLSEEKTLITHARSEAARFLGYNISIEHSDTKVSAYGDRRSINGDVSLDVPRDVIEKKCAEYMRGGEPIHRPERVNDTVYSIVMRYQSEYRGLVQYYSLARNVRLFSKLEWVMETSLAKTVASKEKISVNKVWRKYRGTTLTSFGPRNVFRVTVDRGETQAPLDAHFGGIPLRTQRFVETLNDFPQPTWNVRTHLEERLLADTCELCGSQEDVEVHHIRKMADLRKTGRGEKPQWVKVMAARRRKTLAVCFKCHTAIHGGKHDGKRLSGHP